MTNVPPLAPLDLEPIRRELKEVKAERQWIGNAAIMYINAVEPLIAEVSRLRVELEAARRERAEPKGGA